MGEFDVNAAQSMLKTQTMGRTIIYKAVTGTTMNDALKGAKKQEQPHGTAYIAEVQTKARGSKGRQWNATNSGNLYVSFIVYRDVNQAQFNPKVPEYDLDISGALATMYALEEVKVTGISVKWLNDLWIRGHKLCGVLAEDKGEITVGSEQKQLFILGIGLNINCDIRRDTTMFGLATSTLCETGQELNREQIFASICFYLERILSMDRQTLCKMYKERQTLQKGLKYKVTHLGPEGGSSVCTFSDVKDDWSIDLEDENMEMFNHTCSSISIRPYPELSVYILTGPNIENWSGPLLLNTFKGLVDTTKLDVRSLILTKGKVIPEDCALLVIGQMMKSHDAAITNQIREYVGRGGACICMGNSCSIFSSKENQVCEPADLSQICLKPVQVTIEEGKTADIMLATTGANISLSDTQNSTLVVLGSHAGVKGDNSTEDDSNIADIVVYSVGMGKVCLSAVNVEVTYADAEDVFPELGDVQQQLKTGVFHRDRLILRILHALGL